MRTRSLVRTGLALPLVLVASLASVASLVACESSSDPAVPSSTLDAATDPFDAARADGAVTPVDGGETDAADAAPPVDAADAAPLVTSTPFATGLDAAGTALPDGQLDPHWTVKDQLGASFKTYSQTDAQGYIGYWLAPSATSKFISPFVDTVDPTGAGVFTYSTTFVLGAEVNLANVQLTLRYANDNAMKDIVVNGQALPAVAVGGYSAFETVTVTTPFVRGTNTVSFTVENQGGPTGLRAELDLVK